MPLQIAGLGGLRSIDFSQVPRFGPAMEAFVQLSSLGSLKVSDATLNERIPLRLGELSALTMLELERTKLVGSIPPQLSQLASLKNLSLSHQQFSGSIPSELMKITTLASLELNNGASGKKLIGPIPSEIGNLSHLRFLSLEGNSFNYIPNELGTLPVLEELYLEQAFISRDKPRNFRSIPSSFGGLRKLKALDLGTRFCPLSCLSSLTR